jgi:hypothetical protein
LLDAFAPTNIEVERVHLVWTNTTTFLTLEHRNRPSRNTNYTRVPIAIEYRTFNCYLIPPALVEAIII